ncbi:MAG: hypothetical protein MN733_12700 [Nitrososphaera sp.]|nr:hypothetical protein [Nitrososphaera sp.]
MNIAMVRGFASSLVNSLSCLIASSLAKHDVVILARELALRSWGDMFGTYTYQPDCEIPVSAFLRDSRQGAVENRTWL